MKMALMAIKTLFLRVLCLIFLLISLIILVTDSQHDRVFKVSIHFKEFKSYRFVMCTSVIGLAYTLLQLPFAVHYVSSGKRLVDHDGFLLFEFYGDKVISSLLAMGVGAGFGATSEILKFMDVNFVGFLFSEYRSKYHNFFNMIYLSAAFLSMAFLCIAISSTISALELSNSNKENNTNHTTTESRLGGT